MQEKLLNWYFEHHRILPFRENHSPYRIWVSEIMLQQTQVDTVIPYFNKFMAKFPTIFDLAKANEDEVYKLWEGLGYYSRARNILKCAKEIVDVYDGKFPTDYKKALKLPGIGPYTAGAVLSIAHNLKHPAVDGNVMRVVSRIYYIRDDISIPKTKKIFEEKVMGILPNDVRHFNQALMELGALICTPKNPKCQQCPVNEDCQANMLNLVDELPIKTKKIKNNKLYLGVGILEKDNKILFVKNNKGLLSGLWGFPSAEGYSEMEAKENLLSFISEDSLYTMNNLWELGKEKHIFTHKTWQMTAYSIEVKNEKILSIEENLSNHKTEVAWIEKSNITNYAISTAFKKILKYV